MDPAFTGGGASAFDCGQVSPTLALTLTLPPTPQPYRCPYPYPDF